MQVKKRMIVLGANGMLGSAITRFFALDANYQVYGTIRGGASKTALERLAPAAKIVAGVDVNVADVLMRLFAGIRPDLVINCVGIIKQLAESEDPLQAIPINSLLPHRLAFLAQASGARFVHMSTDCVFSGAKGGYLEDDMPDADDLYGRSKLIGEVNYPNSITLRTSIIGHELAGSRSLIDWFLSQNEPIYGYRRAIFSGLPTVEIARIIHDFIIPNKNLCGLYHVSADPISKFDLLELVSDVYKKKILIRPDDDCKINRSLNSDRFRIATGFQPELWPELIRRMHDFR